MPVFPSHHHFIFNTIFLLIDTKDRRSLTPLHYACQAGNSGIVKLLVESGSDVNNRGFAGTTPLQVAVSNSCSISFVFKSYLYQPHKSQKLSSQ